ncbi:hypothetical protein PQR02_38045 [Paraburkholderia sediminicola]|uniref:Uncharacterized protein n=1 Tax=Paraburkholderia rhynchosiae TaxID=487049 RepID=A0ACC7NS19_9BURK
MEVGEEARNFDQLGLEISPLTGCAYYEVPPGTVIAAPAGFDWSFAAAWDAMRDKGLSITGQDPASGTIIGALAGDLVMTSVRPQADGSVVVRFDSKNARDPALLDRISRS